MSTDTVRCELCGLQIFNEKEIEYLSNKMPIHKNQICPIIDSSIRHIVRNLILGDEESVTTSVRKLDKAIKYHDKINVTCTNCGHSWETIVRNNSTRCKNCKASIYIDKYGNQR